MPLIGFAGAPWTLMSYMVEGSGPKSFNVAKRLLAEDPARAHALLDRLARGVGAFLKAQVRAGAQAVQLFDSWAGALGPAGLPRVRPSVYGQGREDRARGGGAGHRLCAGSRVGARGDRRRDGCRRDRRGLADGGGRRRGGACSISRWRCRATSIPAGSMPSRVIRERTTRDARGIRRAGPHRQSRPRHPAGRAGRACAGVRRCGEGVAAP